MTPCTWWEWTGRYSKFEDGISSPLLKNRESGEERSSRDLPAGALYAEPQNDAQRRSSFSEWHTDRPEFKRRFGRVGPDGYSIVCKLPTGEHWHIDGRCSNCTRPGEDHYCWVRHGTIGEKLHVDKVGNTCSAGGGSIAVEGYHGFLHNGALT